MTKLYSYYRSSSSYRVRIALNLKGLSFETAPVHLVNNGGEQFSDQVTQLNPAQRIPILEHNGLTVSQSIAIIEYLDEAFPGAPLYPQDLGERAHVRQLCETVNSDIQPLQNLAVLKMLMTEYKISEEQKQEWGRHWIAKGLKSFEVLLQKSAGQFCHKDQPGAADCFLVPQIYNAHRFNLDLSPFPKIQEVYKNCMKLDSFKNAHPDCQPDTPR